MNNCVLCGERVKPADESSPIGTPEGPGLGHRECLLRSVLGGIGHHLDHLHWCVVMGDPDGGMTYRQSAIAVDRMVHRQSDTNYVFRDHVERAIEFGKHTFGPGRRTLGITEHIRKELDEILAKPDDLMEWIDIIVLGIDGAWRHCPAGLTNKEKADLIAQTLARKQSINENRTWPDWRGKSEDVAIEHDRSKDEA
jgi:hypothetical protein